MLSHLNHPILDDPKYNYTKHDLTNNLNIQILLSYKIVFPELNRNLKYLSNKCFISPYSKEFNQIIKGNSYVNMEKQGT